MTTQLNLRLPTPKKRKTRTKDTLTTGVGTKAGRMRDLRRLYALVNNTDLTVDQTLALARRLFKDSDIKRRHIYIFRYKMRKEGGFRPVEPNTAGFTLNGLVKQQFLTIKK